nr:MAG TPA: hypothetical protein [Caudoviricetes sp.]
MLRNTPQFVLCTNNSAQGKLFRGITPQSAYGCQLP